MKQIYMLIVLSLLVPCMAHAENKAQGNLSLSKLSSLESLPVKFLVADNTATNDEKLQSSPVKVVEASAVTSEASEISDNTAVSSDAKVSNDTRLMKGIKNLKNLKGGDAVDYLSTSTVDEVRNDIKNLPVKEAADYLSSTPVDKIAKDVTGQNLSDIIPPEKIDKMIETGKNLDVAKVASSASGYAMDVVLDKITSVILAYIIEIVASIMAFILVVIMLIRVFRRRRLAKLDLLAHLLLPGDILP